MSEIRYPVHAWFKFLCGLPIGKPKSKSELTILSEWFFGKPLTMKSVIVYQGCGSYEVQDLYDSYHGDGYCFRKSCIYGYDRSAGFWKYVFGELYCGGIASSSYGQFHITGHREHVRIKRLRDSISCADVDRVRPSYARLADYCRDRKNSEIRGVAVPIQGPGGWSLEGFSAKLEAAS